MSIASGETKNADGSIPDNFGGLPDEFSHWEGCKIVVIPVPFGGAVSYGKGAEKGPRAILNASQNMELYDEYLKQNTCESIIHTGHPVEGKNAEDAVKKLRDKATLAFGAKKFPVTLGGDHSISPGAVMAAKQYYPEVSVLQLDAHADLREDYEGSKYSHASAMARIREMKMPAVQVGIRSMCEEEVKKIAKHKYPIYYAQDIKGKTDWHEKVIKGLSNDVYITLDLDVFDPSIMPSTGTPEPGGLDWYELTSFLEKVFKRRNVVGFDIVELAPVEGLHAPDFLAAKLAYRMMGLKFRKE